MGKETLDTFYDKNIFKKAQIEIFENSYLDLLKEEDKKKENFEIISWDKKCERDEAQ